MKDFVIKIIRTIEWQVNLKAKDEYEATEKANRVIWNYRNTQVADCKLIFTGEYTSTDDMFVSRIILDE